ncbi:MAG TPA: PKD domain-containing protein [Oscillatoriaceae cyanobacterium]
MPKLRTLAALIVLPLTLSACTTYVPETYAPVSPDAYGYGGYDSTYDSPAPMPSSTPFGLVGGFGSADPNGPVIEELDTMPSNTLMPGQTVTLRADAFAPQGDLLAYHWATTDGMLASDAGMAVSWTAPDRAGIYEVMLTVQDPQGKTTTGTLNLRVLGTSEALALPNPVATPTPLPFWTPDPSETPLPTPTPFPTWLPTPTPLPSALDTPAPEASATPSPLPSEDSEERHGRDG